MTDTRSTIATPSSDHAPVESAGMPMGPSDPSPVSQVADHQPDAQADSNQTYPGGRTIQIPDIPLRKLVGLSLVGVGGLIVLFLVYLFVFTPLTAARNQQRLTQSLVGHPLTVFKLVDGVSPAEGSAIGVFTWTTSNDALAICSHANSECLSSANASGGHTGVSNSARVVPALRESPVANTVG